MTETSWDKEVMEKINKECEYTGNLVSPIISVFLLLLSAMTEIQFGVLTAMYPILENYQTINRIMLVILIFINLYNVRFAIKRQLYYMRFKT